MNEKMKDQREGGFLITKIHQITNRLFNQMLKDYGLLDGYDITSRSVYVDESQFNALEYNAIK